MRDRRVPVGTDNDTRGLSGRVADDRLARARPPLRGSVRVGSVCVPVPVPVAVAVAVNWAVPWLSMTNRADSPNNGYSLSTRQSRKREESLCSLLHSQPGRLSKRGLQSLYPAITKTLPDDYRNYYRKLTLTVL